MKFLRDAGMLILSTALLNFPVVQRMGSSWSMMVGWYKLYQEVIPNVAYLLGKDNPVPGV